MRGLIDTTLREGGQTPGVQFSLEQKIAIAKAVALVGIEEIELGVATAHDPDLERLIAELRFFESCPRLALWTRCRAEDIIHAGHLHPDVLSLSLPASERHIAARLGKSRDWVLTRLKESVLLAKEMGIANLSLGIEDASRAESGFLAEFIDTAVTSGVSRIRLADTVGVLTPNATGAAIAQLRTRYPAVELGFHGHNDFGMASANAVSALEAGAEWADVTVLGLGERAGCARLEEVAGLLTLVHKRKDYRIDLLGPLCSLVAKASSRTIPVNHPLVGQEIFTCETGLHVHGLLADPASYEPFPPERINSSRTILLGAKTGSRAVAGYLAQLGLTVHAHRLPNIVSHIRHVASELGRPLLEKEVRSLL